MRTLNFGFGKLTDQFRYAGNSFTTLIGEEHVRVCLTDVRIAHEPNGRLLNANCDVAYLGDLAHQAELGKEEWWYAQLAGEYKDFKVIVAERPDKLAMNAIIIRTAQKLGIYQRVTPATWGSFDKDNKLLCFPTDGYSKLVMKAGHGARGQAQVLFDPNKLVPGKLAHSAMNKPLAETKALIESYGGVLSSESSDDAATIEDLFKQGVHFQEYIPEIVHEYRVLAYGSVIWYVDHKTTEGDYPQCLDEVKSRIPTLHVDGSSALKPELVPIIRELAKKTPVMSLDIYETKDGTQGIFEYSNQFSLNPLDHEWRRKFMQDAITHLLTPEAKVELLAPLIMEKR